MLSQAGRRIGHVVGFAAALLVALSACSGGGGSNTAGASGASGAKAGSSGGGTAGVTASGAAGASAGGSGSAGSGAAGTGTAGSGAGTAGTGGGGAGGAPPSDGGASDGPVATMDGPAGERSCSGRAISLLANGTNTMSDAARARVTIDLMMDTPLGNVPRTIEFWFYVKPTDWVAEVNEIFVFGSTPATLQQLGLDFGMPPVKGMPTNHATLGPYTDGVFDDDTGVDLGLTSANSQWIHVAVVWDMTALRTFVNGVERITTKAMGTQALKTTAGPLVMGCNPPYFGCFNGIFDELRVWSVARTAAEIMAHHNKGVVGNEPGLVGYWKFDDAPGSPTATDSVTTAGHTAHPGVLAAATGAGMPTFVTPDPPSPVVCP